MFGFIRKKKQRQNKVDAEQLKRQEDFINEHRYKMRNDLEYRKEFDKKGTFLEADSDARKNAGLENKIGSYTFICPHCGSECKGEWTRFDHLGNLHGRTDCFTCDIHLIV